MEVFERLTKVCPAANFRLRNTKETLKYAGKMAIFLL